MRKNFLFISLLFITLFSFGLSGHVNAQQNSREDGSNFFTNMFSPGFSLLDPDKLDMSHGYSFTYFSGSRGSGSIGMLMNSIEYRVSNPLTITVDLGVLHSPSAMISRSDSGISPTVIPGFRLHYQPSENMFFQIDFRSYPQGYYWGRGSHFNDFGGSVEFRGR